MTSFRRTFREWLPVILVMIVAMMIRAIRTSSPVHYLLAGADGPYVPLQVRSILEHGRLAFPDMPGLFWLDAALAWALHFLQVGDIDASVLIAVRTVDILLPPLAAIPVFLLGREFPLREKGGAWNILLVAYAILGFTPLVVFSFQLQKNALGVVWMFTTLLFMVRFLKSREPRQLIWAGLAMAGCALTHFGSFSITLLLCLLLILLDAKGSAERSALLSGKKILSLVFICCLAVGLVAAIDPQRSWRWLNLPLHLFEAPVLLFRLHGYGGLLQGWTLMSVVIAHVLAGLGMVVLVTKRKDIPDVDRSVGWAMAIAALVMASPLLGLEWANRLYLVVYIPLVVLWTVLFRTSISIWVKRVAGLVIVFPLSFSLLSAIFGKPPMSIDPPSYAAFINLRDELGSGTNKVVVARQDLQLLANWTLGCRGVAQYLLTKKDMAAYGQVYVIRQLKGKSPALRSQEPRRFPEETTVLNNQYFEVTMKATDKGLPDAPDVIFRGVRGTVRNHRNGAFDVQAPTSGQLRTIRVQWPKDFDPGSIEGRQVEVNGDWIPFSLDIRAGRVTVLK